MPRTSEDDRASPFKSFSPSIYHRGRSAGICGAVVSTLVPGERSSRMMLLRQARVLVRPRGTAVAQGRRLVTAEYPAQFDARARRRAHEGVDCVLKNTEAFKRAFEDRVIERREERHDIAGYPRQQWGPEQASARAVVGGRGKMRQRR